MDNKRTRRDFFAESAAGIGLAAFGTRPYHTAHPGRNELIDNRPSNVVLIMSDEHNPRVTSIHGHSLVQTPNLDRLAAAGTVYENTYCPSPLCLPCRSAFMSGRRVHDIQCYNNCNAFQFAYPSYGQVLRDAGVHTVHIGKVDVYREANALGFSEMLLPKERKHPGDRNVRRKPLAIRDDGAERADGFGPLDTNPFQADDECVEAALRWLAEKPAQMDRPWVLVLQLVKPHFPHRVTQELWDLYAEGGDLPEDGADVASAQHPYARDLRDHFQTDQFSEQQIRGLRRGYLGCVTYVDRQIGRVLDALEKHDLADSTNVLYSSDHGVMLGKFGMWWKSSLYDDSARVPLVAAGPDFDRGKRVRTAVDLHDARAAIFQSVGVRQPAQWIGEPLQGIRKNDSRRAVFSEYHGHGTRAGGYVVRRGDWKLVYCMDAPHQLFNLEDDPDELNNLAEKEKRVFTALERELRSVCDPEAEDARATAFIDRQLAAMAGA